MASNGTSDDQNRDEQPEQKPVVNKRASMREGPLANLFRKTEPEPDAPAATPEPAAEAPAEPAPAPTEPAPRTPAAQSNFDASLEQREANTIGSDVPAKERLKKVFDMARGSAEIIDGNYDEPAAAHYGRTIPDANGPAYSATPQGVVTPILRVVDRLMSTNGTRE